MGSELALFSILGAITLGAISPGPSFVMVVRTAVDAIRIVGRNTQGVKVMTPNDGDKIATLAKLAAEAKDEPE